jgi:preprotein translocase subunit SecE
VARDRKRAKQRRDRRSREGVQAAPREGALPAPAPSSLPVRADVPGALDHASGDVDEFDAALVRGAGGVAATPEADLEAGPPDVDELQEGETPSELAADGGGAGASGGGGGRGGAGGGGDRDGARAPGAPLRGGNRALAFLRASWAELQRVQWPDRRQVAQATAVVLGFVAIAGLYLGLADFVATEIVEIFAL